MPERWELRISRTGEQVRDRKRRTVGKYQVFHDGESVAGLNGATAETRGPGANAPQGNNRCVEAGTYKLYTQDGYKYVDPVTGEPVCGANSLRTGNFTKIGPFGETLPVRTQQNQLVAEPNGDSGCAIVVTRPSWRDRVHATDLGTGQSRSRSQTLHDPDRASPSQQEQGLGELLRLGAAARAGNQTTRQAEVGSVSSNCPCRRTALRREACLA